jgi:deazaflavin-dependent oxidoreductase (nitroreductase family)
MRGQIALYESTAGAYGGTFGGHPVVILTTTGAKTGKACKVPVMRVEHRGVYVAVASAGGSSHHPQWYYSLLAYRDVQLQDGDEIRRLHARVVFGTEKERWWAIADTLSPNYAATAGREIPILALEPAPRPAEGHRGRICLRKLRRRVT